MTITIWDVAVARGVKQSEDGGVEAGEFARVGLPFLGGCESCQATIGPVQAAPSRSGYLRCNSDECLGGYGFESVEEFEAFEKAEASEVEGD